MHAMLPKATIAALLMSCSLHAAGSLKVVSAEYGTPDSKTRVESKRLTGLAGVFHFVTAGNHLVDKDPAPFKAKQLVVTYLVNGKPQVMRCNETESYVFCGDAISPTKVGTIAAAYYGIDNKWADVTSDLRAVASKGNDLTAGTAVPKSMRKAERCLVVFTSAGGSVRSSVFKDADIVPIQRISPASMPKYTTFRPGQEWIATDGAPINAHGGGIIHQNGIWYWFGEIKGNPANSAAEVSCYSSTDLYNWNNEGIVLAADHHEGSEFQPGCVIERPKVIYNSKNRKYVMWFHLELKDMGYKAARTGVAVSDKPTGPYQYVRSYRPNAGDWPMNLPESYRTKKSGVDQNTQLFLRDFEGGQASRDMTVFVDDDGKAYHIHAAEDNATIHISELSDNYGSFSGKWIRVSPGGWNEAPAVFKHNNKYFMITSGCTGWDPNTARLFSADTMLGEWKFLGNPCSGKDAEITFGTQGAFILPVQGMNHAFIFMADRWDKNDLQKSGHVWLPIHFDKNGKPDLTWNNSWSLGAFQEHE